MPSACQCDARPAEHLSALLPASESLAPELAGRLSRIEGKSGFVPARRNRAARAAACATVDARAERARSGSPPAAPSSPAWRGLRTILLGHVNPGGSLTAALAFNDLTLGYDRHPAVHHLDAEIPEGSLTAIVGPNGAGKSTLLKGVIGTLTPLEGRVAFGTLKRDDIAYLPQQSDVDRSFPLSVVDLVAMGLWREIGAFGRLARRHRGRVEEAITAVGLTGFEDRPIGALSGGQMQRALFARLLLQDARLVLLDEPFTAIDQRTMADLLGVVRRWHGEGRTVLAVLHDFDTVRVHFPRTLMLARELVAHGPTEQVLTAENQLRARAMAEAPDPEAQVCARGAA